MANRWIEKAPLIYRKTCDDSLGNKSVLALIVGEEKAIDDKKEFGSLDAARGRGRQAHV